MKPKPDHTGMPAQPLREPSRFEAAVVSAFLLAAFLYVWLRIEPPAEYYSQAVVFFLNASFFHRFLAYPGGLLEYGAAALAQLNCWSWLGALTFTALTALQYLAARGLCRRVVGRAAPLICLAPALVLLAWRGRYDGHTPAASLALVLALGTASACALLSRRPAGLRWPAGWVAGALLFYAAGLWPLLLCLFFAGWLERRQTRKWLPVLAVVFPALLIPVASQGLRLPVSILNPWGSGSPLIFASLAFLLFPAGAVALTFFARPNASPNSTDPAPEVRPAASPAGAKSLPSRAAPRPRQAKSPPARLPRTSWWRQPWAGPAFTILALLAGWVAVWGLLDGTRQALAQIEGCAALKQYDRLLAVAARLGTLPPSAEVRADLALYHTGRLTQDLFVVASRGRANLLPGMELGINACLPQSQTLLELGQVNEAEHLAQEALEFQGDRPDALRLLAQVNILKGRPNAAAVFLSLLSEVPLQGAWAADCLAALDNDPRLAGDRDLDLFRSRMPTTDLPHDALPTETMLLQSLNTNPKNQMAFEYLMAHYLLTGDFKRLARHAGQLQDFAYLAVPRHIEEALLLGQKIQGLEFDLRTLKIRPETVQRFQSFGNAMAGIAAQGPSALPALAPEFGDTFWHYYYSRLAPRRGPAQ